MKIIPISTRIVIILAFHQTLKETSCIIKYLITILVLIHTCCWSCCFLSFHWLPVKIRKVGYELMTWDTNPWSNFRHPHWELICHCNKWHQEGTSEISWNVSDCFCFWNFQKQKQSETFQDISEVPPWCHLPQWQMRSQWEWWKLLYGLVSHVINS